MTDGPAGCWDGSRVDGVVMGSDDATLAGGGCAAVCWPGRVLVCVGGPAGWDGPDGSGVAATAGAGYAW